MFLRRLFLALCFFTPLARAAEMPDLVSPENRIVIGENDAPWRELAAELRAHGNVTAPFTENRYLPFKKIPVVFTGRMRLSAEGALSLQYESPEKQLMLVDARGVMLRDSRGRTREVPSDPRANAATTALLHVMRFDLDALSRNFELYGRRDGDTWQLVFDPRPGELSRVLNRLVVTGKDAHVKQLEMRKSALQGIVIVIGEADTQVEFSDEERREFFR